MAQVPATDEVSLADGVSAEFTVPFLYLKEQEVFCTVNGVEVTFTFINAGLILLDAVPAAGATVRRYRSTEAFEPRHEFENGVPFLPRFIDENNKQFLYSVQEAVNETAGTAAEALAAAQAAEILAQEASDKVDAAVIDSAAQLRLDLADPTAGEGATLVAREGGGSVQDAFNADGVQYLPYKTRTQFSRNQDRPHILDWIPVAQHAAIVAGTSTYDATANFHTAIAEVGEGSVIWLPARGLLNITSVNVDKFGITFAGENSSGQYYQSRVQGTLDGVPMFNVTQPQFALRGVGLFGLSNTTEKGSDITQDAVRLAAPTQSDNLDTVFSHCAFAYFRYCVDMRGRNVRAADNLFSNSRIGINVNNYGLSDVRGLEAYDNRWHSMGKTGLNDTACVWVDAAANFNEVIMSGGEADDCVSLFRGFAGNSQFNVPMSKARGNGIILDDTGHTLGATRRQVSVHLKHQQDNGSAVAASALRAVGSFQLDAHVESRGTGSYGVEIGVPRTRLSGSILDAGQFTHNTYDGVLLGAAAAGCTLSNLVVLQDAFGAQTNKARYGINDLAQDTFYSGAVVTGTYGTARVNKDSALFYWGLEPGANVRVAETYGSAAPTTGTWGRGSRVWNTAVASTGTVFWVCIATGTPGTWRAVAG